jgi:adenosylhomocysteine nucleosidase
MSEGMLGFVVPLAKEAERLIERLHGAERSELHGRRLFRGTLAKRDTAIILSGCGKVLAASSTQLLIDRLAPSLVFHLGTAGAISPELEVGDLVVGQEVLEHDHLNLFPKPHPAPVTPSDPPTVERLRRFLPGRGSRVHFGRILSGDQDIVEDARRRELHDRCGGLCVDWESSAVLRTCALSRTPAVVIRAISDQADGNTAGSFLAHAARVSRDLCDFVIDFLEQA